MACYGSSNVDSWARKNKEHGKIDKGGFYLYYASMARMKSFFYIIDNLTAERGEAIRQSLKALSEVEDARYSIQQGFIEVRAKKDVEAQLRLACEMFGAGYRTKMKKSDIF